jgi:hypothetical protein
VLKHTRIGGMNMRKFVVETLTKKLIVDDIDGVVQAIQSVEKDPQDKVWFVIYGEEDNPCLYLDETLFTIDGYAMTHSEELMKELNDTLDKALNN